MICVDYVSWLHSMTPNDWLALVNFIIISFCASYLIFSPSVARRKNKDGKND